MHLFIYPNLISCSLVVSFNLFPVIDSCIILAILLLAADLTSCCHFRGELMDDAMILPCGHSFGSGGVQHVIRMVCPLEAVCYQLLLIPYINCICI